MTEKKTSSSATGIAVISILIMVAMFALVNSRNQSQAAQPTPAQPTSTTETSSGTVNSRCVPASARQFENISTAIKDTQASNSIDAAWAVKSKDFSNVWFVAAEIQGPGINPGDAIGLWAISGDPDNPGLTLSVNGAAIEFSGYPDGSKTDAQTSPSNDGAQEALSCAGK